MSIESWSHHVKAISLQNIAPHFITVQLAQAILESGRGTSVLFLKANNPYGIKYRKELERLAIPLEIKASDGIGVYAKFNDFDSATTGYWVFINRVRYRGWELTKDENQFIKHLVDKGYAGNGEAHQASYLGKLRSILPEARHIVRLFRGLYL
jgi:flagellum-specific peptidoglycan hydrolase FlgJ